MDRRGHFFTFTITIILTQVFFINTCFAQQFSPSEYSAQIRLGLRSANSAKDNWGYADFFIPVYNSKDSILYGASDFLLFVNSKIIMTDFSTDEQNLGIGFRYLAANFLFEEGVIFGSNLFFDTAYSKNGIRHNQVGFGIEFLSQCLDLRGNYYQPVSDEKIVDDIYAFGQKSLLRQLKEEEPLPGFDAEIGIPLPVISSFIETWVYGGGYWYNSKIENNIKGVKGRVEVNPSPVVTFTAEIRNDDTFGRYTFIGGYVSLPFDIGNLFQRKNPFEGWQRAVRFRKGKRSLTQRMTEPVIRDINIITVDRNRSEKAHDMIFVDNSNDTDSLEDGSLAHPHNTLAEAFTNSDYTQDVWIYVKKGDNTSNGYTGNFALADRVVIWGEGYQYLGLGGAGYPVINGGAAGNVFTLANDNTLMGMKIQNGNRGIYGKNITSTEIKHNIITSNGVGVGPGIYLGTDGTYVLSAVISNNTIISNNGNGMTLYAENSSVLSAVLSGNTISSNSGSGIYHWSGDSSAISSTFSKDIINGNSGSGIYLQSNSDSTLSASVAGSKIYSNTLDGIYLEDVGTSILTLDAGNGSLNSAGYNSIYNNGDKEIDNQTVLIIKAENNWWGQTPPALTQFRGEVDYSPYLDADPN